MAELFRQYKQMFDNMVEGAFFQNADGSLFDINPAALRMFGLSRDQFMGRTSYHPEWRVVDALGEPLPPEQHPSMVALRTGRQVRNFVAGVFNPHLKSTVWLEITATPLLLERETAPGQVFVTLHDITTLKLAEKLLQCSEERYRAIVNTQTEFVDRYLPGGILTFVNDALCRYWGVKPADLKGKSFFPFIHEDDRKQLIAALDALCPEKPCTETETRIIFHDGSIHWHSWTHLAIFDQNGTISEYQSVGRDITAQKMAEIANQEQAGKLALALEAAKAGMWERNLLTGRVTCSRETYILYGMDPDQGEASLGSWYASIHPDDREQVSRKLEESIKQRQDFKDEYRVVLPDGTTRWLKAQGSTSYDGQGRPLRISGIVLDITTGKLQEEALKSANEELELRVEERTASLTAANDQIRRISFHLLKAEEKERMRIAAELHDHVGQSLLLAKMKIDTLATEYTNAEATGKSTAIASLLEQCIQEIRTLTFAMRPPLLDTAGVESALEWLCKSMGENYRLQVDFSCCCQPIQLNSEQRYSLYQAVRELLLNVAKHAGVNAAQLSLKSAGNALAVQVSDHGCGFETALSGSSASDRGFGLFSVQQRVEYMGGSFGLVTKPGQGTAVTLTIPMGV